MELYKNFRSLLSSSQKFFSSVLILCLFMEHGLGITVEIRIPSQIQPKIFGGGRAEHGQFPYIVSIQLFTHLNKTYCGGTILDDRTILTAAHCILESQWTCGHDREKDCYSIVAGEHDLRISEGFEQTVNFSLSDVITHKDYNPYSQDNDIALIKLKTPLDFSRSRLVQPILLVDPNIQYNTNAFIVGWGSDEFTSEQGADILQKTTVTIFSDLYCNRQWGDDYHKETMICASGTRDSNFPRHNHYKRVPDACKGDSGGPLITQGTDDNSKWYLVGIVSWGFQCGIPEYPGMYTRVENYLAWIRENRQW